MMPIFAIKTGSLPAPLAQQAIPYASRKDFTQEAPEGFRWCFVGYKHNKESIALAEKQGTPLLQNFAVPLAIDVQVSNVDEYEKFKDALVNDYQDKLVHDVADMKSLIDPTDMDQIIKDYFDTSRNRTTPSLEDVTTWFDEVWTIAYMMRVEQRNEQASKATPKEHVQTKAETERIVNAYKVYMRQIAKKTCPLSQQQLIGVRQSTTKLMDLGFIEKDEIVDFLLERITEHLKTHEAETIDAGV